MCSVKALSCCLSSKSLLHHEMYQLLIIIFHWFLTLYLQLKDNLGIDVENLCFQKTAKNSKLQIRDYVIFKLCFKLDELELVL